MTLYGIKIWDDTGEYYYTEIDVSASEAHNKPTESKIGYYSKYPYHISNGNAFYFSGNCKGCFADNKSGECENDYNFDKRIDKNGNTVYNTTYVVEFVKWLHNGHIKQLQLSEQWVIPVGILGEIQMDSEYTIDEGYSTTVSFNWEQLDNDYSLTETNISQCPTCNNIIAPTSAYCQHCGSKVSI